MIVWVAMEGDWDDQHPIGVYENLEDAKEVCKKQLREFVPAYPSMGPCGYYIRSFVLNHDGPVGEFVHVSMEDIEND